MHCLPPYSPDFNPIENAFAKLKAMPSKAAQRSVEDLWAAVGRIRAHFTSPSAQTTLRTQTTMHGDQRML